MTDNPEILFDEQTIAGKVEELASRISKDYAGKELVVICVLKGAFTFTADLLRNLTIPVTVEFVQAASYGDSTTSTHEVVIKQDLMADIKDKHVLLVDTIIDTGKTLAFLFRMLSARNPARLAAVALLNKKSCRTVDVPVEYCGFEVPDAFVVGYGLDFAEQYRNLPYIAKLDPEKQEKTAP